jgi:bacteriorhodopsin
MFQPANLKTKTQTLFFCYIDLLKMCGVILTWWMGRKNNGRIENDTGVRGQAINTRVVKLQPVTSTKDGSTRKSDEKAPVGSVINPELDAGMPKTTTTYVT